MSLVGVERVALVVGVGGERVYGDSVTWLRDGYGTAHQNNKLERLSPEIVSPPPRSARCP